MSFRLDVVILCLNVCLIFVCVCVCSCSPDLIAAFKDVTLESLQAAGAGPSPAASAAAPGSSYPPHMKVGV